MSVFTEFVKTIDIDSIKKILEETARPCYESQLIKAGFVDIEISSLDSLTLYQTHFALFHILYKLQEEYYRVNHYLHIHFMRTFLLPYPEIGKCRYYYEEKGEFCNVDCSHDHEDEQGENPNTGAGSDVDGEVVSATYCRFHQTKLGEEQLETLSSKYFYLDESNYYKLDKDTAEDFVSGSWEILAHYTEFKEAYKTLDLPEGSSQALIKSRYKELARKYHPDVMNGSVVVEKKQSFSDINKAYRLLMKLSKKLH